ncbi:MAG: ABC transporter permease [Elusimicrobiota bacterium]
MKNKIFKIVLWSFLVSLVLFFLIFISGLFQQLKITSFQKQFATGEILFAIKLTLLTATVSSTIALIFAVPIAYILSRYNFPLKNLVNSIMYLPIVISPIALGAMLLIFFTTPIGNFFETHLFRVVFEVPAIILAQFIVIIGLAVSLIKSVFDYINPEYELIARTLGASQYQTFFRILLPTAKKGIISAFLLVWARAVGEFGATVTLAGATTMKTETLPVAIFLSFASCDIYNAIILILVSLFIGIAVLYGIQLYAENRKPQL